MKDFIRLNFLKVFFAAIFFIGCYPSFCQSKNKPVRLSKEQIREKVLQISTGTIRDFGDLNSDLGQTDFAELVSELESLYKQFPDHKFVRYIARKLCLARKCDEEAIEIIKNAIEKLEDVFDQDLESSIDPVAKAVVLFCRKLKRIFCYFSLEDFICNEGGSFTWFAKKHIWEAGIVTTVICSFLAGYYLGKGNREQTPGFSGFGDFSRFKPEGNIEPPKLTTDDKGLIKNKALEINPTETEIVVRALKCSSQGPTAECPFFSQWNAWKLNQPEILVLVQNNQFEKIEEILKKGSDEIRKDLARVKDAIDKKIKQTKNKELQGRLYWIKTQISSSILSFNETAILYELCPDIKWLNPSNGVFRLNNRLGHCARDLVQGNSITEIVELNNLPVELHDEFPNLIYQQKISAEKLARYRDGTDVIVFAHQPGGGCKHFVCFCVSHFKKVGEEGKQKIVILVADSIDPNGSHDFSKEDDQERQAYLAIAKVLLDKPDCLAAHFPLCLAQDLPFYDPERHKNLEATSKAQNADGWIRQDISGILKKTEKEFCHIFQHLSKEQIVLLFDNINEAAKVDFVEKVLKLKDAKSKSIIFHNLPESAIKAIPIGEQPPKPKS